MWLTTLGCGLHCWQDCGRVPTYGWMQDWRLRPRFIRVPCYSQMLHGVRWFSWTAWPFEDGTDRLPRKYGNELPTLLQVISQNMEDLIQLSALNLTSFVTLYIGVLIFKRVYQRCIILSIYGVKLFEPTVVLKIESYNLENTLHVLYKYVFLWCIMKLSLFVGYCLLEHCASYLITWRRMQEVSPNAATCYPLHNFSERCHLLPFAQFIRTLPLATLCTVSPKAATCYPLHSFSCQGILTLVVDLVKTSNIANRVCSENQAHPQNLRVTFWRPNYFF